MSKLTKRITAMLLSGMLAIGSATGSVYAAAADVDPGLTSEIAEEVFTEEPVETSEAPVESAETSEIAEEVFPEEVSAENTEAPVDLPQVSEEAPQEEAVTSYTVTLDANGGYFTNEWDDSISDYVEQAEVVVKQIPVGGTVTAFPTRSEQDGQSMVFAGWSLERDGEIVSTGDEEYAPVENCVLYAVWKNVVVPEEESWGESEENKSESTDPIETAQEPEEVEEAEKSSVEEGIDSNSFTMPETEDDLATIPDQEAIYTNENEERSNLDSFDTIVAEEEADYTTIDSTDSEEETVNVEASLGIIESGKCGDNLTWSLDEEGTLTVSGKGDMFDYNLNTNEFKKLNIKEVIIEKGVTSIGQSAFSECTNITKASISSGVKSIGNDAFYHCDSLYSVTIPDSVSCIGDGTFSSCESLENLIIPGSVSEIGEYAFSCCDKLTTITIPYGVTNIGEGTFSTCLNLTTVVIPDSVTSIGDSAFKTCTSLKNIVIPDSVTYIGNEAFSGCSNLDNVKISNNITSIGDDLFYECRSLISITIPSRVTWIGKFAFSGCNIITSIIIPKSVTDIDVYAFSACSSLRTIEFTGNAPNASSIFYNVTATAYYPSNNSSWTESKRQKYGGTITWIPWDGTDPIVTPDPSSFSISIGTPENSAVVIDDDGQLSTVAYYGFSNKDTALNEAKNIKWTCSDASAVEIYDPVYDLETNDVRIALSLRGKKPGTYTITGTAPDGRKASADVVVEPKMVALSDKKEITDTTDVEMLQVTLSSPDKAYLTSFLNGITCDIKDDYGAIGGAEGKRVEISDDGKIGKLIYTLTPIYGGNAEFTLTSRGGQKTTETIYSLKNIYPGGALYEKNTVVYYQENDLKRIHFDYSLDDCLSSSSLEYNPKLAYMLISLATSAYQGENTFTLLKSSDDMFPNDPLAITESLRNLGFSAEKGDIIENNYYKDAFDPNYKENSTAFSIATKKNSEGEDILVVVIRGSYGGFGNDGFFHLNWGRWASDWRGNTNFHNYDTGLHEGFNIAASEIIDEISSFLNQKNLNKNTLKFVVTGHSRGAAVANLVSKKLIDSGVSKEKVYDYNFACPDSGRDYDGQWNKNNEYGSIFNINNVKDIVGVIPGNIFNSTLNLNTFFSKLFHYDSNFGILFWGKYGTTYFFAENWDTVSDTIMGNPGVEHQPTYYLEYLSQKPSADSFMSWTEARIKLFENGIHESFTQFGKAVGIFCPVDVTITNKNGEIVAEVKNGNQQYYNDSFGDIIILTANDQSLIYLNEDYYTITLTGTDNGTLSYFVSDIMEEENESGLAFENINLISGKTIENVLDPNVPLVETKLFVLDQEGNPIRIISEEGEESEIDDETDVSLLPSGCYITEVPISSNANTNGIEIELDKGSYAIQEGDILTIDATVKTDKEHIEGQNEYIGYFAYYANKQWNQLASWDIEGGTTKYKLKLKKDTWDKYGDVIFTVSVFPKDSFVQGSALVDKVFLVDISKKTQDPVVDTEDSIDSGTCGRSLTWSLSKEGTLAINGNGKMSDWTYESPSPWNKYASEILNVVIENGVTSIGNNAFYNCRKLKSVSFGETVAEIGECAFMMTYELHKVAIPDSVKTIKESAFSCSWIEELTLGNSVERIEDYAFGGNFALTEVVFPESISYLGKDIFEGADFKDIYYCGEAPEMEFCVFNLINNEEDVTVYIPVWSESWNNEIKRNLCLKNVTWKTWNPGNKKTISSATINLDETTFIFTGKAIQPSISVSNSGALLKNKKDYNISYSNNINAGTAKVNVKGTGNYYGTVTKTFKINKAPQSITSKVAASRIAVGKTTTVSITGNKGSKSFKSSDTTIATVTSSGKVTAKKVGTVKITATSAATANYNAASKTVTIKVVPAATASLKADNQATGIKLTWKKVTGANGYKVYRGSTLIKTITNGSTVTFADTKANTNGTKYTYKVVAKAAIGDSTLSKSVAVYRVARPSVSSVTNSAASKMTVKWGKNAKATGYQIQYSTDKTFKSGNKAVTVAGVSAVSKVIGSLTKNKTYYVRIRTYKTVGSAKYWSVWSAAKSVKIAK